MQQQFNPSVPVYGSLPAHVQEFSRTKTFTEATVPEKLRENHSLNENTWGLLNVISGKLKFYFEGTESEIEVAQGEALVIEPKTLHHVVPSEKVSFYIAFYR